MDTSKPLGDACRDDGTLKDASEMVWPNSPTDDNQRELIDDQFEYNRALNEDQFRDNGSELEFPTSESKSDEAPKVKVSHTVVFGFFYRTLTGHILLLANKP